MGKEVSTIVIFDKNYKFLDVAYQQLTSSGVMSASYTVKEAGYAFLYVSNEQQNQTDVYFDDVTMSYTPTSILQSNEYYPFGLQTANSWTRDNTTNKFLYDGGSELNSTTGMYDLPYRNYDAALGRFFQVDPLAQRYSDLTPYHYAGNNPIIGNDPSGLYVDYSTSWSNPDYRFRMEEQAAQRQAAQQNSDFFGSAGGPEGGSWSDNLPGADRSSDVNIYQFLQFLADVAGDRNASFQNAGNGVFVGVTWEFKSLNNGGNNSPVVNSSDMDDSSGNTSRHGPNVEGYQTQSSYRDRMSREEIKIYDAMSSSQKQAYLLNGHFAKGLAEDLFPESTLFEGKGDAFRHALFSALNARDLGADLAKQLGDAHELVPTENPLGRSMDLFNNQVGRDLARGFPNGHFSNEGLAIIAMEAVNRGLLREIVNGALVPTH